MKLTKTQEFWRDRPAVYRVYDRSYLPPYHLRRGRAA